MKFILFLLSCCLSIGLAAQDTIISTQVDVLPLLNKKDIRGAKKDTSQEALFLRSVYGSVTYPAYARQNGVDAVIGVIYLVDEEGRTFVEATKAYSLENAQRLNLPLEKMLMITALKPSSPTAQNSYSNEVTWEIRAKAYRSLEIAVAKSILALPRFEPGRHQDKPVVVRYNAFFHFRIEK
jgi:hypothetical protein